MTKAEDKLFEVIFGASTYGTMKRIQLHPNKVYAEACKLCFLKDRKGPEVDALRRTVIWMDSGMDHFRGSVKHDELLQF